MGNEVRSSRSSPATQGAALRAGISKGYANNGEKNPTQNIDNPLDEIECVQGGMAADCNLLNRRKGSERFFGR